MIKLIHNFGIAWKSPRWRWAILIAVLSDILSFVFVLLPPVQWIVDALTAILLLITLGFRWGLMGALVVEVIPAIELFPAWTLVVLALASTENDKSEKEKVSTDTH